MPQLSELPESMSGMVIETDEELRVVKKVGWQEATGLITSWTVTWEVQVAVFALESFTVTSTEIGDRGTSAHEKEDL